MSALGCCTCRELYPGKPPSSSATLGQAPNKYCYRCKCHDRGIALGHIKSSQKRTAAAAGNSNADGVGVPEPMAMAREIRQPTFGPAKLMDIQAVYGFRYTLPRPPCLACTVSFHSLSTDSCTGQSIRRQ